MMRIEDDTITDNFIITFVNGRGGASSKSQGGQKAQFAPIFRKIHFLLHFYVTIFWIFSKSGGSADPSDPLITTPLEMGKK